MLDTDKLSADREAISQACGQIERAAHKLKLLSVRKKVSAREIEAQIRLIQTLLGDLKKIVPPS